MEPKACRKSKAAHNALGRLALQGAGMDSRPKHSLRMKKKLIIYSKFLS